MKTFLATAAASAVLLLSAFAQQREVYQMTTYQLGSAEKAEKFDAMMAASIPTLKANEVGPIGVFKYKGEKDGDANWRIVLATAKSLDVFPKASAALVGDSDFLTAATPYLSHEKSDPAFARVHSSTFLAFEGLPKLVAPAKAEKPAERFFELRIYESHSEYAAFMKIKMFNEGELDIFKDVGLKSVFFGQALTGDNLPNLTYMLAYDDEADHKKAWDAFRAAPAWKALKSEDQYKDTVSKIVSKFLVTLPYSDLK